MPQFNDNQFYQYPPYGFSDSPFSHGALGDTNKETMILSTVGKGPKGDKGDMTGFDDLTDEQKSEIYAHVTAAGNKSIDAVYTTTGASTTTIEIPIADFDTFDMLFVDINGLDLAENDDYTISGNSIVLATPLPAGQEVHFRALRYQLADGDKTIVNTMGRHDYNTVAEMQADNKLKPGDICHTLGFHEAGDGGAAWYKIKAHGVANGMDVIACGGVFANLIVEEFVTPEMFGALGNNTGDDSSAILKALDIAYEQNSKVILGRKRYRITNQLTITHPINIEGLSSRDSIIVCENCNGFAMLGEEDVFITGVYIKHLKLEQTTLRILAYPDFEGESHKGVYLQCLNSIIEDVTCKGFEYGFDFYNRTQVGSIYQQHVKEGENHIVRLCEATFCTHGFILNTHDMFAADLVAGYCKNGIFMTANKLQGAHVWGWFNIGYRFTGADYKPANASDIELETSLSPISATQYPNPYPVQCANSVTINGFTYWSIGLKRSLFHVLSNKTRLIANGVSIGDYGAVDPSIQNDTDVIAVVQIDSNIQNALAWVQGSILDKYITGQILINNSASSRAVSAMLSANPECQVLQIVKPAIKDTIKMNIGA